VMLVVLHLLTRRLFAVAFEWGRLAHAIVLLAGTSVAGEVLLPDAGVAGFATRTLALAAIALLFAATRFMRPAELASLRDVLRRRRRRAPSAGPRR